MLVYIGIRAKPTSLVPVLSNAYAREYFDVFLMSSIIISLVYCIGAEIKSEFFFSTNIFYYYYILPIFLHSI